MLAARPALEVREDRAQRGTAEPPQSLRAQRQPLGSPGDPALPAQLPFQLPQPAHVRTGLAAEQPLHRLHVDVVERRAGMLLPELVDEVVEVRDLAEHLGRLAVPEPLLAAYL